MHPTLSAAATPHRRFPAWFPVRPEAGPASRRSLSVEGLVLAVAGFMALTANLPFFTLALAGRAGSAPATWGFGFSLGALMVLLNLLLLLPWCVGRATKPVLAAALVAAALCSHYTQRFGIHLDPSMMRNLLRTDPAEARELIGWPLLVTLAWQAALPIALMWRLPLRRRGALRAVGVRLGWLLAAAALAAATVLAMFQPFASLMRNHKEARYLIAPAAAVWSIGSVLVTDARGAALPRAVIGQDARPGPLWAARSKPMLVVMVVGETARAANWGLNGTARQTTPQLAARPVINFPRATACGTNTEVSLPCMFAPVGRRRYDEDRIRGSQSLLHVLARAGVGVTWRDNQSGCKGTCAGLPYEQAAADAPPALCENGHCRDAALLHGLDARLDAVQGTQFLVLHMLGNHGPSYFRRYPGDFEVFKPACHQDDLQACSAREIGNAYDNALRYTDAVLARLIDALQARSARLDSAMVYVSDHGESLGERGLFLHGMPYAIAPDVQKEVPLAMWFSPGFAATTGLDTGCLRTRATDTAQARASHDNLFHTLLGLMDVDTALYEPAWDLTAGCRHAGVGLTAQR